MFATVIRGVEVTSTWFDVQAMLALSYLGAATLSLLVGGAILLYERFSPSSRRFFLLTSLVAGWFVTLTVVIVVARSDPSAARVFSRLTFALQALTAPAVFGLALHLTGSGRRQWGWLAWAGGLGWAGLSLFTPLVSRGVTAVASGRATTPAGWVGLLFVLFLGVVLAAAIYEWVVALRGAATATERRRHQAMLAAMGIATISLADYFSMEPLLGPVGISGVAVTTALVIIAMAQVRYRSFSPDPGIAADAVLRAMADAVLVCDEDGVIRIANPEAGRLLGAEPEELVGRPVEEVLGEPASYGSRDPWQRRGTRADELSRSRDRRMVLLPADGAPVPVRVSIETLSAPASPKGWVIVAHDVRPRMAVESALQASELRYRSLFRHNPGLAYEFTMDGIIVAVNPTTEKLLEVERGALIGRPFADLMAPEALEAAGKVFRGALAGEPREYELDVVASSGARKTLRGVSLPVIEDGQVTAVFGVALDVTEEARAKRALEVQRRYFAELFESSPEGIVILDHHRRVVRTNGEFTRLFGYTQEEAEGCRIEDLVIPEGRLEESLGLIDAVADGGTVRSETVRQRKDGSLVEVSVLARQVQIPGEAPQTYGVYRDISDRKATERKLREREEELRHAQKLESVGQLAGGVAHDFNNLLTVINGHARLVLDTLDGDHPAQADLQEIERAGVRAASLTQQLLAFSRRQVLRPEVLDLNLVVADLERMLRRLIGSHITLETRLVRGGARVLADRGQIDQVIINLVVNARDAMPDGGTLIIQSEPARLEPRDPEPAAWGVEPGDYVRLAVADTGVGMTEEVLARAFDPFFTTKDRGKGTGLGLATVFGIVKQSGGHVTAHSKPGEGARICVYLPATARMPGQGPDLTVASPISAQAEPTAADEPSAPVPTVLVVEDEAPVRRLAVRVLERHGYRVLSAHDGADALRQVSRHPDHIDVLVTDLVMPVMGGRELAARMRELRPDTAILIMSGYDEELVADGLAGAEFIPKPFTPTALVERVATLVNSTRD
jgi:two-component system, cell cycle sensor histidine kinase and response regulator CckA